MTNPLKNIESLPDDDLYKLLETLITSTEFKQKLVSDVDSMGGITHLEKITINGIERKEKNI